MQEVKLMCNIVGIIISVIILIYVSKLERDDCACSKDWKRTYIKVFALITIIISILMCVRSLLYGKMKINNNVAFLVYTILFFYAIGALVNIFVMFTYSQNLIQKRCLCSRNWTRTFMYYYSMIIGIIYFIAILVSIILSVMINTNPKYAKKLIR